MRLSLYAVLAALTLAGCAGPGTTPVAVTPSEVPTPAPTATYYTPPRVTVDEAHQRIQQGEAIVVVDVRGEAAYESEHIPGAVNVPWVNLKEKYSQLPKDKLLLLYCT